MGLNSNSHPPKFLLIHLVSFVVHPQVKLRRLLRYMKMKDLKSSSLRGTGFEEDEQSEGCKLLLSLMLWLLTALSVFSYLPYNAILRVNNNIIKSHDDLDVLFVVC